MRHTIKHGNVAEHPVARGVFMALGIISVLVALTGLILPFIPGILFLIVATYFFARSSEKFHQWLMTNKYFGHHLTTYANGGKIPTFTKVITVLFILISLTISIIIYKHS